MFQIYFRDKVPMAVTNVSEVLDHLLITEQNLINIKKTCIYIYIYMHLLSEQTVFPHKKTSFNKYSIVPNKNSEQPLTIIFQAFTNLVCILIKD